MGRSQRFGFGRTAAPAPATIRSTAQGEVIGLVTENGAHTWRGLPFAASTAGPNRWRAPRPPSGWKGRREAVEFADRCAQLTTRSDERFGLEPGIVVGSEDCLALDIYAPSEAVEGSSLPVMVWIHGGGNVWGRSSMYDGSRLAQNEDVIVVAVQHRVGPLGWFAHDALRASAETDEDTAASFAILDLIAGLRWVRDNIASFGGDPGNVTVFGESSGGHNTAALLASPLSAGLFHRAIVQSGAFDSFTMFEAEDEDGGAANPSRSIAARLGVDSAEGLRSVAPEALIKAYTTGVSGFLDVPRVISDGVALPEVPLREAFSSTETFHSVPITLGTNRDETKLFYFTDPRLTSRKFGVLVLPDDHVLYEALTGYLSRIWRIRAVDEPAAAMRAAGHDQIYSYRFDWDGEGSLLSMDLATSLGAAHGFEIPFVFNRFSHLGDIDRFLFPRRTRSSRERLSRAMGEYWASFARNGAPTARGGPAWPRYGNGSYLQLDTDDDGGMRAVDHADSLRALVQELADDRTITGNQRRFIIDDMQRWMFTQPIHPQVAQTVGAH